MVTSLWLETGPTSDNLVAVKRGQDAMAKDPALRNQIRGLCARHGREKIAWEKAGKRDIIGSLCSGHHPYVHSMSIIGLGALLMENRTEAYLGPSCRLLADVVNALAASFASSWCFPGAGYLLHDSAWSDRLAWYVLYDQQASHPGTGYPHQAPAPESTHSRTTSTSSSLGVVPTSQVIVAMARVLNVGADLAAMVIAGAVGLNGVISMAARTRGRPRTAALAVYSARRPGSTAAARGR